jgi:hypothetical protein
MRPSTRRRWLARSRGRLQWTEANTEWPGMMAGLAEARLLEALIAIGGARR